MGKIIFFDLDGVLIQNETLFPHVEELLEKLKRNGHHPMVCTGRGENNVPVFFRRQMDGMITLAGAYCMFRGETLINDPLKKDDLFKILGYMEETDLPIYPESNDHMYAFRVRKNENDPLEKFLITYSDYSVKDCNEWTERFNDIDIHKFSLTGISVDVIRKLDLYKDNRIILTDSGDGFYEIMQKDVTKGSAIIKFLKLVGKDPQDAVCFGDSENDLEMFDVCGTAVAVGNALSSVKKRATLICEDAEKGGVYKCLLEMGLI